jgi:hypothetical protein
MSDEIEHLRKHVESHKNSERAMFTIAGLKALLDELDDARGLFVAVEQENVALTAKVASLKEQVERLLANEAKRISEKLVDTGKD